MTINWKELNEQIVQCRRCERLTEHCRRIAVVKRKAYRDQGYWGKPVPNFGKRTVPLLIVGLAPGAHGANRTGRMFTGDRSGLWLYRALFKAGFCSQQESDFRRDGLKLYRCAITAVCHCAPPDNKPTREEIANCAPFLDRTMELCRPRVILALGSLAWNSMIQYAVGNELLLKHTTKKAKPKFGHAIQVELTKIGRKRRWLVGCYHPSQQNTFTGRLNERMLDDLLLQVNNLIVTE